MTAKEEFTAKLQPLLIAAEAAINAHRPIRARKRALQMLALVEEYKDRMSREDIRDALNNPTANAIAERLGVKP